MAKTFKGITRKGLLIFLALAMMVSMLSACGSAGSSDAKTTTTTTAAPTTAAPTEPAKPDSWVSDEPLTFSLLYRDNPDYPFNKDWLLLSEITKRTNVTLDIQVVPQADWDTKVDLMYNSGDTPDIVTMNAPKTEFALNGLILPSSDYMDKTPYFAKFLKDKNLENDYKLRSWSDGKFYGYPGVTAPVFDTGMAIRMDLLQKYGMEIPRTGDDLYNYLKKFKDENPKSVPLTIQYGADSLYYFMAPLFDTFAGGWMGAEYISYDAKDDKFIFNPTSENFRQMVIYLNKLHKDGLLDPEATTQTYEQFAEKIISGKAVCAGIWAGQDTQFNNEGKAKNADYQLRMIPPVSGAAGIKGNAGVKLTFNSGWTMPMRVKDAPYFDKLLKFVDWYMYSEEASILCAWGVEGVTFEVGADGKRQFKKEIKEDSTFPLNISKNYGLGVNSFKTGLIAIDALLATSDPQMAESTQYCLDNSLFKKEAPPAPLTPEEKDKVALKAVPLKDYVEINLQLFISGKKNIESDWSKFLSECEAKGYKDLEQIFNDAYARVKAKLQ